MAKGAAETGPQLTLITKEKWSSALKGGGPASRLGGQRKALLSAVHQPGPAQEDCRFGAWLGTVAGLSPDGKS